MNDMLPLGVSEVAPFALQGRHPRDRAPIFETTVGMRAAIRMEMC